MESGCGHPCMADQRCTMDDMAAGAGDNASADESCSPACIDTLQPFLGDDTRPCLELPRRFVPAISANGLQCTAHCTSPPCEPTNVGIWPTYRGKYTSPRYYLHAPIIGALASQARQDSAPARFPHRIHPKTRESRPTTSTLPRPLRAARHFSHRPGIKA